MANYVFIPGTLGHSVPLRGWHVIYQGSACPSGYVWEAWDPSTGEIIGAPSFRDLSAMIRAGAA